MFLFEKKLIFTLDCDDMSKIQTTEHLNPFNVSLLIETNSQLNPEINQCERPKGLHKQQQPYLLETASFQVSSSPKDPLGGGG